MSKKQTPFIDQYLSGRASAEDINESIDAWHAGSGKEPIYDYLGMTEEEYAAWLRNPGVLSYIARARKERKPIAEIIDSSVNKSSIAPRSSGAPKARGQKAQQKKLGAARHSH